MASVLTDGDCLRLADALPAILLDRDRLVATDGFRPIPADGNLLVVADSDRLIVADFDPLVVPDLLAIVVLHVLVLVLLSVDVDLLLPLLVLEPDLVEVVARPPLRAAADDAALRPARRQRVRHYLLGVVDAPGDDRTVRVALEEVDDH